MTKCYWTREFWVKHSQQRAGNLLESSPVCEVRTKHLILTWGEQHKDQLRNHLESERVQSGENIVSQTHNRATCKQNSVLFRKIVVQRHETLTRKCRLKRWFQSWQRKSFLFSGKLAHGNSFIGELYLTKARKRRASCSLWIFQGGATVLCGGGRRWFGGVQAWNCGCFLSTWV